MLFTRSQNAALSSVLDMARLFFSKTQPFPQLKLRLFPLLLGPTGVGKSSIVASAARRLNAHYIKRTRGDWIVLGSKAGRPTMFQILDYVATYDRLVLHIDELDKFTGLQNAEWSASIASDLWGILDLAFQIPEYLNEVTFSDRKAPTVQEMEMRLNNLFIVGSGTFQDVFEGSRLKGTVGFNGCSQPTKMDLDAIVRAQVISPELVHRFNGDPIFLEYPSTEETRMLLISSGIANLADELGIPVKAESLNWSKGGMRVLESVATRLALAHQGKAFKQPTRSSIDFPDRAEANDKSDAPAF